MALLAGKGFLGLMSLCYLLSYKKIIFGVIMKVSQTELDGVLLIEPTVHHDSRGRFFESYAKEKYRAVGIQEDFVQDNQSLSNKNVLRGLHYRIAPEQSKLVRVVKGEVFDVVVDIRKSSPTFGKWQSFILSDTNHLQLYVPVGFAHGFCVLSDTMEFLYKVSEYYSGEKEKGLIWNDPDIGIDWPISDPILSDKDKSNPRLRSL
ncbi:MAG: dTDP-4-dehydrorhamnose 3,5-epimerase [Nitrospinaceae bacterium]|nr:dTDP-4-dehydrorhamnose 3,5-epimerase [Nitrospinaceae bacterium]